MTFYTGPEEVEEDDDETPRQDQPIRCRDGMCGCEDCERCNI